MLFPKRLFLGLILPVALWACSADGSGGIQVEEAWTRATRMASAHQGHGGGKTTTAVYLTIRNRGAIGDRLLGAETALAPAIEMHQSIIDENQVMRMRKVEALLLEPGETVRFEPGSYHFMLIGLTEDLKAGDQFEMKMLFEGAGVQVVPVRVRSN